MPSYLVRFTPLEPYFFGNEKTFSFADPQTEALRSYFIRSERAPTQTTILGALRYCSLERISPDFSIDESRIGPESFSIIKEKQSFGIIGKVSPLFITDGAHKYIHTPFDHIVNENGEEHDEGKAYRPFREYKAVQTINGERLLPADFKAKSDVADSFIRLENPPTITTRLFAEQVRTGVQKTAELDGFYKREYRVLQKPFSFAVYADIDDNMDGRSQIVYLGQEKSAFRADFTREENSLQKDAESLFAEHPRRNDVAIALSDLYVANTIYQCCRFANTKKKDYRGFSTRKGNVCFRERFTKGSELHHLLRAGSMFLVWDWKGFREALHHPNCEQIGFNQVICWRGNI